MSAPFWTICLLSLSISLCAFPQDASVALRAGSARTVITPDLATFAPVYMAGFGMNRKATAVHDEIYARCLVLKAAKGNTTALCSVDVIGLFFDDVEKIRKEARARISDENLDVIVAATHSHEGPDTMGLWGPQEGVTGLNEKYMDFLRERVVMTIAEAAQRMKPAKALLATASDQILTASYDDTRPPVVHDDTVTVLALRDRDDKPLGTLVNWTDHPEALGSKNTEITADFLASFYRELDAGDASVVFWNGPLGGMQSPLGGSIPDPASGETLKEPSFRFAEVLGLRLAAVTRQAIDRGRLAAVDEIRFRETMVRIPVTNQNFIAASKAGLFGGRKPIQGTRFMNTPVGLMRLLANGRPAMDAALIPGEAYPELSVGGIQSYSGADIPGARHEKPYREIMTALVQMVVGLANDEIGYIIPQAEWDEKPPYLNNAEKDWYGEVNSPGPETAPLIANALADLVAAAEQKPSEVKQ